MEKYLFSNFEPTDHFRQKVIEFLRVNTNAEIGGYRLHDGSGTHYMQNPVEITDLVFALKAHEKALGRKLDSFLEIGYCSGVNNTFLHKFFQFSNLVAVDILGGAGVNAKTFYANLRFKNLTFVCGSSTDEKNIKKIGMLGGYDLIFVDGGHDYETVRSDYRNYREFLNPGGAMVFHDIAAPGFNGIEKFWKELRAEDGNRWNFTELVDHGNHTTYGIGLITQKR